MATKTKSGLSNVDRFWSQVEQKPRREHGYVALLGLRTYETGPLHSRLEEGLSYQALERLREVLDVSAREIADLLRISPRTLARRKDSGRLQPDESDRLLRLSRLVGLTLKLFEGDLDQSRFWLANPHQALANESPLTFATTEVGAREVEHLIGRLEHGVAL